MLLLILVKLLGIVGAIGISVAMAIGFPLIWWVANKRYPMPWFNFKLQS